MHIAAIRKFVEEHPDVESELLTTSQINSQYVKPETLGTNQPFINKYIDMVDPDSGKPLVAPATVFVSHAWRYNFNMIVVEVMEEHAWKDPDAYYWFDLFTNNQNEVASKDFDWFCTTFREGVKDIGEVLLVLSPWDDPLPIRRAWCLFEIFTALDNPEVKFDVGVPHYQINEMKIALYQNSDCLVQVLSDVQAQDAEAKVEQDRDLIFDVIRSSSGGFSHVNKQVKNGLRAWYVEKLRSLLDKEPENPSLALASTAVLSDFGCLDEALDLTVKCVNFPSTNSAYKGRH